MSRADITTRGEPRARLHHRRHRLDRFPHRRRVPRPGHQVLGLARSDASAAELEAKGAEVLRGDLDDLGALRRGAESTEGTVHLANKHDFADPASATPPNALRCRRSRTPWSGPGGRSCWPRARRTGPRASRHRGRRQSVRRPRLDAWRCGEPRPRLRRRRSPGAVRPLRPDRPRGGGPRFRRRPRRRGPCRGAPGTSATGRTAGRGPRERRRPPRPSRRRGRAPRAATARRGRGGDHTREIATAIGRGLGLPVVPVDPAAAAAHFGWIGMFFGLDLPATSERTRALLGWEPTGPTLAGDLAGGGYFA